MFSLSPEVDSAIRMSLCASPASWRAKISAKPKSLAMQVMAVGSALRQTVRIGGRVLLYLPMSSSERWRAWAADPPLPAVKTAWPCADGRPEGDPGPGDGLSDGEQAPHEHRRHRP